MQSVSVKRISISGVYIIHLVLLTITLVGAVYFSLKGDTDWVIPFLTIPLINILILPFSLGRTSFDPTHPLLLILVSLLIGTVLRSFFIVSPLQFYTKFLMLMGKPPTVLLTGIFAIYLGLTFMIIGYLYPAKPLPDLSGKGIFRKEISIKKFVIVAIIITAVSVVTAFFYFQKMGVNFSSIALEEISKKRRYKLEGGGFSSLGYYQLFMDMIGPVYYMLLIYMVKNKTRIFSFLGLFALILFSLNVLYPFIRSSRSDALYVLIYSGLIIYFLKGKIKWRQLSIVLVLASAVLIIMTALRQSNSKIGSSQDSVESNPLVIMVGSLNFLGVDKTSHVINGIPEKMPYAFGSTLFLWVLAPIPHTVWIGKPDIRIGLDVGEKIYAKRDENSPGGGVPPGFIPELYLNFGYVGIIVGMFLFGLILKLVYNAFVSLRSHSTFALVIYIQVFVPFALKLIGGDLSGVMVISFSAILPTYLIMLLTSRNKKLN